MTDFSLKFLKLTAAASVVFLLSSGLIMAAECRTEFESAKRSGGNAAEKINLLKRLIGICPEYGPALIGLARWHEKKGDFKSAKAFYRRAIAAGNAGAAPYAGLGDVLYKIGDKRGAAKGFRTFLSKLEDDVLTSNPDQIRRAEKEYRLKLEELAGAPAENPSFSDIISSDDITKSLTSAPVLTRGLSFLWHDRPFIDVHILFDTNSSNVKSVSLLQLKEIAKSLNSPTLRDTTILIEGHTDSEGSASYNLKLSTKRAKSVQRALTGRFGVRISRTQIKGYGESRPTASNATEEGKARNRRVTFVNVNWKK